MDYVVTRDQKKTDELYHYGVKGMKWGRQRYQNKDGSLTSEGKRLVGAYKQNESNLKKLNTEGNNLINSHKKLKKDFGKYANVDDDSFLEYTASGYGLNTDKFRDAKTSYTKFYKDNTKSIKAGKKIIDKYKLNV